ncbi:helix-turn-helix domain-containing protein [Alistipes timonensis]|mgnify:FL=1|uniref:helix-turn-helix domain-containing protein n=1 Tax=Alistipes timonensis TaxID=1465754 RepID=UPI003742C276
MRIPDDIAVLGVDNDETICRLSAPNLSSLNQNIEQGGYDVARLINRIIRDPEAEREDVMVWPTHIVTRQSTDIYANNNPHIAEVLKYIHENISQKISVDDLVSLVPLSRRLLETRFKRSMGTSIYDYIIQVRIEKMTQLLSEGMSVSEAAVELGFSDIKNVSRSFKQLKGITPSEYRQQVIQGKF